MRPFESLTVFLLATNETDLLRETVKGVLENCPDEDLDKIIFFLKSDDCPSAFEARAMIEEGISDKFEICIQKSRITEEAFEEIPPLVTGSHFVIMASDGEMDTATLKDFITVAKQKPGCIACGAKWHKDSVVIGHDLHRTMGSKFVDIFAAAVFGIKATDLFSIFQIYPIELFKEMNFHNPRKLMYEFTLKPIRLGVEYIEIPTVYKKEKGHRTNYSVAGLVAMAVKYCYNVLRIRFTPKRYL